MKRLVNKLKYLPLLLAGLLLGACEETIAPGDRYKPAPTQPERTVLVEEYTGMECPNCVDGHDALGQIETLYNTPANLEAGIGVIAVGIHIPVFGYPVEEGGLVTPEASQLAPGQTQAPAARINRRGEVAGLAEGTWMATVAREIERPTSVTFTPVRCDVADGKVTVSGSVNSSSSAEISATLHVWILEDGIVNYQSDHGSYIDEYVHNNVYRASVNGLAGEAVKIVPRGTLAYETSMPLNAAWNPEKLRAVVFLETPDGVLNAAQGAAITE